MLKDLFRIRRPGQHQKAPGWLAPGRRVYAVGDAHGCADRLWALHALVAADLRDRPVAEPLLIHLGDYIDRGPDSAAIIDRLSRGDVLPGVTTINLMGNHEWMMLDAVANADPDAAGLWLDNGGEKSLQSWQVALDTPATQWASHLPQAHLTFMRDLAQQHVLDGYVFVHAGLRPGVKLAEQTPLDRLWIREPFLSAPPPLLPDQPAMAVVHGHTPARTPGVTATRIGVDTGAVRGGDLTCAVLEGDQVWFLQT